MMEEAKIKLEKLLEKAESQKINIWNLKSVQKNHKYYEIRKKNFFLVFIFVAVCVYIKYDYLFHDENVSTFN